MSAFYYFKKFGYERWETQRDVSNAVVASTITLHTPTSGKRVAITNLVVSSPINGSMAFYFQSAAQKERKILEVRGVATSATLHPLIECLESTAVDCPLLVRVNLGMTDGWSITAEGFDVD